LVEDEVSEGVKNVFSLVLFDFSGNMGVSSQDDICAVVDEGVGEVSLSLAGAYFVFGSSMEGEDFDITIQIFHFFQIRKDFLLMESVSRDESSSDF